ncbi:TPA: YxeA family protein [Clostridium perfringens]
MKILSKIILVATLCFVAVGITGCGSLKDVGSDKYYLQVSVDGNKKFAFKDGEEDVYRYEYRDIKAYDESGNEIKVVFTADKNLRKGAFLEVRVRDPKSNELNSILSYKEVQVDELPSLAKEKLNVK